MIEELRSGEEIQHAFEGVWIRNNVAFLARYWHTTSEALQRVAADPEGITEFQGDDNRANYVSAVVDNHLDHHNHGGILLTYAMFDEFMVVLSRRLGKVRGASIMPRDLRDRGVRRYKKFVHQVCRIPLEDAEIDWQLLQDMSIVRNAVIHGNGNKSLLDSSRELEAVVVRRSPSLSFRHKSRLVLSNEFVWRCLMGVRKTALSIHRLAAPTTS